MKTTTCLTALLLAQTALAVPAVFFGEDVNDPNHPASASAHSAFTSSFSSIGTEGFDNVASAGSRLWDVPWPLHFGEIDGAMSRKSPDLEQSMGESAMMQNDHKVMSEYGFAINFNSPVDGLGMFIDGLGTLFGRLSIELTFADGTTSFVNVGNSIAVPDDSTYRDTRFFWGYEGAGIMRAVLWNSDTDDRFTVDDVTVGKVPETMPLSASAVVLGLVCLWHRKKA